MIIATEGPTKEFSFLTETQAGGELELIEYRHPHVGALQARLNLGIVNLSRSTETVLKLLHQSKIRFMSTHWSDAFERSAWQRPAEWTIID